MTHLRGSILYVYGFLLLILLASCIEIRNSTAETMLIIWSLPNTIYIYGDQTQDAFSSNGLTKVTCDKCSHKLCRACEMTCHYIHVYRFYLHTNLFNVTVRFAYRGGLLPLYGQANKQLGAKLFCRQAQALLYNLSNSRRRWLLVWHHTTQWPCVADFRGIIARARRR